MDAVRGDVGEELETCLVHVDESNRRFLCYNIYLCFLASFADRSKRLYKCLVSVERKYIEED